ncbi:MAG: hypothetical protein ACR2NZ_21880 [Rubripirellula sp.]
MSAERHVTPQVTEETKVVLLWKAAECHGLKMLWSLLAQLFVEHAPPPMNAPPLCDWASLENALPVPSYDDLEPPIP